MTLTLSTKYGLLRCFAALAILNVPRVFTIRLANRFTLITFCVMNSGDAPRKRGIAEL